MAKITLYFEGNQLVFEGEPDEIAQFLKRVQRDNINLTSAAEAKAKSANNIKEAAEIEKVKKSLPSVQQVKKFIMSRPDYQHTTFDVQREFFGRTFKARGLTEGLFHEFLTLTRQAREDVVKEKGGSFENTLELGRHKVWKWHR